MNPRSLTSLVNLVIDCIDALIYRRKTAILMAIVLGMCWGVIGWFIGSKGFDNTVAGIVLAVLGLLIGEGLHSYALDFNYQKNEKPSTLTGAFFI